MGNTSNKFKTREIEDYGPALVPASATVSYSSIERNKSPHKKLMDIKHLTPRSSDSDTTVGQMAAYPGVEKVVVEVEWTGKANKCAVSGTFNEWKYLVPMSRHPPHKPGLITFRTTIELPVGVYEYKFFVDDKWVFDPEKETTENSYGTSNNVLRVKRDRGVVVGDGLDALNQDDDDNDNNSLLEEVFGHEIPPPTSKGPPTLPKHLLQIILNKHVPDHVEPTLLPEPNHVMLNHLYALSIKDGVMVLSTTHRYRRKYITTLFYTPIMSQ